jgi:hypothetical protein
LSITGERARAVPEVAKTKITERLYTEKENIG